MSSKADDAYEEKNDATRGDVPSGDVMSDDYVEGGPVPVQKDDAPVEDPIDASNADTDAQLGQFVVVVPASHITDTMESVLTTMMMTKKPERDEKEAIDKSNIIKQRTRHAKPQGPGYSEGPEEDDLPKSVRDGDDGTSAVRTG